MVRPALIRDTILSIILFLAAFFTGCSGPFHLSDMHSTSTPKPQALDIAALAREPVATLAMVTPPAFQGYGPSLSHALSASLSEVSPPIRESPVYETMNRLNEKGLAADYAEMISEYAHSGILDRKRLKRIGSALGVRYVVQPGIGDFREVLVDRFQLWGWRLVKARAATLRLWLRLWDAETGQILWEAAGEGTVTSELLEDLPTVPLNEIARRLWSRMIQDHLLGEKTTFRLFSRD